MEDQDLLKKIEEAQKENAATIGFLRGYVKGLEERISRLERSKGH